ISLAWGTERSFTRRPTHGVGRSVCTGALSTWSAQADTDNAPYIYGLHMENGDQIGFQLGDLIFTDYITEDLFTDNRTVAGTWTLTIGDGAADEDPTVMGWNRLGQLANVISVLSKDVGMEADFFGLF
ncbi:hypothetical protein ABT116_42335, partial [Streptomyces sp. NPDC002130]|uniref:hypothetical protein n=1 Tax=Streptomyces sp. NPDC002130 TaxID=3155568 RepID=UPI003334A3DB